MIVPSSNYIFYVVINVYHSALKKNTECVHSFIGVRYYDSAQRYNELEQVCIVWE